MSSRSTTPPLSSSVHGMVVEITVQDPTTLQDRVFHCALAPLRSSMRYFEPHIARQVNEVKMAAVASPTGTTPPVSLRAKCDHRTFEWLLDWVEGKSPSMTLHNIVNISLSSNYLQMRTLADDALLYMRTHLPEIVSSSVDLTALPVDLVLRLSRVVRDSDLAMALQHLYDRKNASNPNRAFVASLLHHYLAYRLGVEGDDEEGGSCRGECRVDGVTAPGAAAAAGKKKTASGFTTSTTTTVAAAQSNTAGKAWTLKSSSGLRWCRLCASLFDQAEVHRLLRAFQLSSPECPAQSAVAGASAASSPPQQASNSNGNDNNGSTTGSGSGASTVRCVGPRGEVFTTHAESRRAMPVVLEAPPVVKSDRADTTASTMRLERWAWRVIGATRYVSCRRCFHLVPLIAVPSHHCSNLPQKFASPDSIADDVEHLVRWFSYCEEQHVYAKEGGITALQFAGPRSTLAEEVVEVRLAPKPDLVSPAPAAGISGVGVEKRKSDAHRYPAIAGAPAQPPMSFWAAKPFYVAEVMDKGIVDIDIQNYVERQHRFEVEAQQRKAAVLFNPPLLRLASAPVVTQTSSSSPSPRFVSSLSGASSTGSLSRGKASGKPTRMRATARSPYGF